MMYLVTGGSASGKSVYAEKIAMELDGKRRYYIAAMKPSGEEGRLRVEKHRRMRDGNGFVTIECFTNLKHLTFPDGGERERVILLECLSNLAANEQFDVGGSEEEIYGRIVDGILCLQKQANHIIIVTNEVFSDGVDYDEATKSYIRLLGKLNVRLAGLADCVTEVVFGIPVTIKP